MLTNSIKVTVAELSDIIASGIQQEQNSESTDVDEPFSPSTKETFDLDSTSPQTFSAMSDSAPSDRQHGTVSMEAAAVEDAAEVDLMDSADSASLLLQSHDVTTSGEDADKVHERMVTEPQLLDTGDISLAAEMEERQDHAAVDAKSSQEEYPQPDTDAVHEETLNMIATSDKVRLLEDTSRLESAGDHEATVHAVSSADKDSELSSADRAALSCRDDVVTGEKQPDEEQDAVDTAEVQDDKEQEKYAEVVPQISISVCSSVNAEDDDDVVNVEETSAPVSAFEEEETVCKDEVEEGHELSGDTFTCSDAEVLTTVHQDESGQATDYHAKEDDTSTVSDRPAAMAAEPLLLIESSRTETELTEEQELQPTEPVTPEIERNLSQYIPERVKETHEETELVVHEKHERKELTESLAEAQQLHDAKLLCSSTESMVSSTASDWTVVDTRDESQTVDSFSAVVATEKEITDAQQHNVDEPSTLTPFFADSELVVSQESRHDVSPEIKDEAFLGGLESTEDDDEEIDAMEDYLTATVTPTVDLLVMSTALESILEEEERTSSSQKTTSSSEKLEHEVSDSSKLVGSSPDVQQAAESPTFHAVGKFTNERSSDRDDVSVSSSLAEFERLERELQEKGSSESCSGGKGSSESAAAAVLPESPQHKSSTSLSSSLAEFERIEHDILGQSGSLELITVDRRSHHTDSSSFSELERIEEMDKNGTAAEEQFRSSSGSLAEFEYIEQQLRQNEELESEALKVASMLEKSHASPAEKSPEVGSSQSDVRLSKEQIPLLAESMTVEEHVQPAASTDTQYPHYQDIVHIIREASKNVQTFEFGDHETSHISTVTETVSPADGIARLRQEETTSVSVNTETSEVKTTSSATVTKVSTSTERVLKTEHQVVVEHSEETQRAKSPTLKQEYEQMVEHKVIRSDELSRTAGTSLVQRDDVDLMMLSSDSLTEDVMQLSTDSLQPDTTMTTSTDSLELADAHASSTSSATTLLAAETEADDGRGLMERSVDSLESDSREPSGEWVTVYERQDDERSAEGDAESTDSLERAAAGQQAPADDAGVSGSASLESFEADSLQDDVEEPTLVSSQSQDSLLVAGSATTPMDISFGSSGAWSQSSNVSSCTTLASSSDNEALTCSADVSATSGGEVGADRRLSEPLTALSFDNTSTLLDSEGNIVLDEPRTPRLDDVEVCLDNRRLETTDKQSFSSLPVERTGHSADETQPAAASAVDVLPGMFS